MRKDCVLAKTYTGLLLINEGQRKLRVYRPVVITSWKMHWRIFTSQKLVLTVFTTTAKCTITFRYVVFMRWWTLCTATLLHVCQSSFRFIV